MTWAKVKDILTILVIPATMWLFSQVIELEADRVASRTLQVQVTELKASVETLRNTDVSTAVRMARLETRLDGISSDLAEIKTLIRGLK